VKMKSAEQRYPGTLFVQPPCTWEIKYDSLKAGLVEDAIEKKEKDRVK